ncbi:MAG: hypothetical protein ACLQVD_17735 [Capsulimonadaceae bacterium]
MTEFRGPDFVVTRRRQPVDATLSYRSVQVKLFANRLQVTGTGASSVAYKSPVILIVRIVAARDDSHD